MAQSVTKYTIFLASTSELNEERNAIDDVITELNRTYGARNGIMLELLKWETHSAPGVSSVHVQDIINKDLGTDYDIFIGMLWSKFGSPTALADSGTEEEFNVAYDKSVNSPDSTKLLFYFKNTPKAMNEIDPEQYMKVAQFKKKLQTKNVLYSEFDSTENLMSYLRMHIPKRIEDMIKSDEEATVVSVIASDDLEPEEFGLLDYVEEYTNYLNEANHSITKITEATEWIGQEVSKKADELRRINNSPNSNPNVVRSTLQRTASLMTNYTQRIELESPIFHMNFEQAINQGIGMLNVIGDFDASSNIEELEETNTSIMGMKKGIDNSITSMEEFFESVDTLPRLEKNLNSAKRKMANEIRILIERLQNAKLLAEEFSKQISDKVHQLKLD